MKTVISTFLLLPFAFTAYSQANTDTVYCCFYKDTSGAKPIVGKPAAFPGGSTTWLRWLNIKLGGKQKIMLANKLQGKCRFGFNIDTTGKIIDLYFCSMKGTMAEQIVRDILSQSPAWQPAISDASEKIVQHFCQSISFEFGEADDD